uniref:CUE domain-containing protein n=1 Tax=Euplotes harpa TaxID=151035 RepID=A0A7S3J355_9SPIT|mmetsp:Transcript_12318/g.14070  ORF Transcript_12318/g.14070 Transcript_12318/m.14070 type:complete len:312 (+) Transcript_12318:15-950(+)
MNQADSYRLVQVNQMQAAFPSISKSIIENELRKTGWDFAQAKTAVENIQESVGVVNKILGEDKAYDISSDEDMEEEDEEEKDKDSDPELNFMRAESYESQDEQEAEEIDQICASGPTKTPFAEEDSEELYSYLTNDLTQQFPGIPEAFISETVKYFYPNMGKIEFVIGEFQKHAMLYELDFKNYKKARKERRLKTKDKKHNRDDELEFSEETKQLMEEIELIQAQLAEQKGQLSKEEKSELKGRIKTIKKTIRAEKKGLKKAKKDERQALKREEKRLKRIEKEHRKKARADQKEAKGAERGEKDYQDDRFF